MVYKCIRKFYLIFILINFVHELEAYFDNTTFNFGSKFSDQYQFRKNHSKKLHQTSKRYISFEPTDDNLELGITFGVPFLSIPMEKRNDNRKIFSNKLTDPIANINTGAIALTALVGGAAVLTGYLWRGFNAILPAVSKVSNNEKITKNNDTNSSENRTERADTKFRYIMDNLELILKKYNINAVSCVQRTICTIIKNASENVSRGQGTSADKILDGLISINWVQNIIYDTPIADSIKFARYHRNCKIEFSDEHCNLKNRNIWNLIDRILRKF